MTDAADHSRALSVALVAMSKAISVEIPNYARNLSAALTSAESSGLGAADLEVLRLLIKSARQSAAPPD